jgi:glycosyltransferase involved in cell wall biosynthesis
LTADLGAAPSLGRDRLRISLVCPFDPNPPAARSGEANVGGVERVFGEVAKRLAARGHDVTLLCSTDGRPGRAVESGVQVVREKRRLTLFRAPVCTLTRRIPYTSDIIHVAATYPFTTPAVLHRARRLGIPAVLDFHFEPHLDSPLGKLAAHAYQRVGPPSYLLADAVAVRSLSYADRSPSLAGVPKDRLQVVPNGFDPERFKPTGPLRKGDYLLFVGRLVPYKGLEVLLQALAKSRVNAPLLIVGDGPLRAALRQQATRLGLDAHFLGHVPDADLPALYRGARLTILPSVNKQEAFGIALIESMACGTPVLASALPGVKEVAEVGGLTAPPGDVDALAARLKQALEPGVLVRGPALASRVGRLYSWEAVTDRLLEVYADVLARRRAGLGRPEVMPAAHPGRHPVL